jgi:hypothetical protein
MHLSSNSQAIINDVLIYDIQTIGSLILVESSFIYGENVTLKNINSDSPKISIESNSIGSFQ